MRGAKNEIRWDVATSKYLSENITLDVVSKM